jgi:hypothetical protein
VRVRRLDRTSFVAGVVIAVSGIVLLLDRLHEIDLHFAYAGPLLLAAVGAILITAGLEGPHDRE